MMRRWAALALLAAAGACAQPAPIDSAEARFDLGRRYRNGDGVPRDAVRGHMLIAEAAQRGHPGAMFLLSNMLADGDGVARNEAQARKWLEAAGVLEHPEALQQMALHAAAGTLGYAADQARAAQLMRHAAHAIKHRAQGHTH